MLAGGREVAKAGLCWVKFTVCSLPSTADTPGALDHIPFDRPPLLSAVVAVGSFM